ncbi:MAG: MATE family efflux transporter [Oscillospiraceae bacterium]
MCKSLILHRGHLRRGHLHHHRLSPGPENAQSANKLFSQNLATLVVIGVTISVLVLAFTEPLARLLGAEEVTLEYTIYYLQGLAPFAVCFMISYNLEVLVKTDGRPRLALVTVCVGCVTNCVLDYLAIFHWGLGIWAQRRPRV